MRLQLLRMGFPVRLQGKVEVFGSLPIEFVCDACACLPSAAWKLASA